MWETIMVLAVSWARIVGIAAYLERKDGPSKRLTFMEELARIERRQREERMREFRAALKARRDWLYRQFNRRSG